MQNDERWMTSKEVSESLSISRRTLMLWINTKGFPAVKVGKFGRYKQDEIDRRMRASNENLLNKEV